MNTSTKHQKRAVKQGVISIAKLDANDNPLAFYKHATDKSGSKIDWSVNTLEHKESESGLNEVVFSVITELTGKVSLTIESNEERAIALGLMSVTNGNVGATVTAEPIPNSTTLVTGGSYPFPFHNVTTVTNIIDSTPTTPVTLVAGTDYMIDLQTGMIEILDAVGLVGPLKSTFTYGASTSIGMMTDLEGHYAIRAKTINLASDNQEEIIQLHKIKFKPMAELPIKSDGVITFTLEGVILANSNYPEDAVLGRYGSITRI